jgi:hypothetical protein
MAKENKTVRIVFEATPETHQLLRLLAAQRGQKQKDTMTELIKEAAEKSGLKQYQDEPQQTPA